MIANTSSTLSGGSLSSSTTHKKEEDEQEDNTLYDEARIEWTNLIFLPFNPIFKLVVLVCVLHKIILGPLNGVYGLSNCSDIMNYNTYTKICTYIYKYPAPIIYFLDTFLHIVHRQVTDKALRRQHLPKSAYLIMLDILALIPFHDLTREDVCTTDFWSDILSFTEFVIVYRIVEYFELTSTHACWKQYIGYTIFLITFVNFMACFLLLLTLKGLCSRCWSKNPYYDWRLNIQRWGLNETEFNFHCFAYQSILAYVINFAFYSLAPFSLSEHILSCLAMYCSYALTQVAILPKLFAESVLSLRRITTFNTHVQKIIYETKRRNPSPTAYINVTHFYELMWIERKGITSSPEILHDLPRYLRVDIREDLVWPVFYHSPTFRKTSTPFKRFLVESIRLDYKLPGEKFFAGPHCHSNMYFLKSGIVQLLSTDDGVTPVLSVTSGTLFGDINFYAPPLKKKMLVKCLTYCEVLFVTRGDLLKCMHRYPDDRTYIFQLAKEKINHARALYSCKKTAKGLNRVEDEGMDWLKRRWWEISDCIDTYRKVGKKVADRCELPPEETDYHCAKYIGQLVLSTDAQMKQSSLFVNDQFPWVLAANSTCYRIWRTIVLLVVMFVLVYFPPNIAKRVVPPSFLKVKYFVDFVYTTDICVSLFTSVESQEHTASDFASVMLIRFKSHAFVLDILAALWIEQITEMVGKSEYFYACLFNRLLKIYMLFPDEGSTWKVGQDYMLPVYLRIFICYFSFFYITAYFTFMMVRFNKDLSSHYYFIEDMTCDDPTTRNDTCLLKTEESINIALKFIFSHMFKEAWATSLIDIAGKVLIAYNGYLIFMYCKARFIATLYLKYRDIVNYQRFVTTVDEYYRHHDIHVALLKRLERYLNCHWRYHYGADVMHPNSLNAEPFDIFWKVQGEVAEKIIGESPAFVDADPALVKELAYIAKFLLMPENASLFLFGVTCKNVTWIVQGYVKVEYKDEKGDLVKGFYSPGEMISVTPTLLGKPSLRTYVSCTDCEILHINTTDFMNIMRRHPHEWEHFRTVIEEFKSQFDEVFDRYIIKHVDYQRNVRERAFHARRATMMPAQNVPLLKVTTRKIRDKKTRIETALYVDPQSGFMKYWMPLRAFMVVVGVTTSSLEGGIGAKFRWYLNVVTTLTYAVSIIDMIIKFFLAYYDDNGILITSKLKTMVYYLTHTFIVDLLGVLPWHIILTSFFTDNIPEGYGKLLKTSSQFAFLYILTGYFDYLADKPSTFSPLIKIAKLQVVTLLIMLAGSHFLVNFCVDFVYNAEGYLVNITSLDTCWFPRYMGKLKQHPTIDDLKLLFAQSINLAQCGLLNMNYGQFHIATSGTYIVPISQFVLAVAFWYVVAYSVTMLLLLSRSDTLFLHGVQQLKKFLKAERIEKDLIQQTMSHFGYWRIRTKGINLKTLMFERIGMVLRQDMSYFFFKSTYSALDSLLEGGDQFQRQMASVSNTLYFLPNAEIMREMDLMPSIYIVHRGRVVIMQNEEKLAVLTKGSIFGQLTGNTPRPVKVTAIADGYADVLQTSLKDFNDALTDEIKESIANNAQSKSDFIATKKVFQESPHNTIRFLLRGRKTIKLPWMTGPTQALKGTLYSVWLYVAWLFSPAITCYLTAVLMTLPRGTKSVYLWTFIIFDLIHLLHTISEYYTVTVAVVGDRCVNRKVGWRLLKDWRLYTNILSLLVPIVTLFTRHWAYQAARLLRLILFYDFHKHFCVSYKSKLSPFMLKSIILSLLLHSMACGWIFVSCRDKFPRPPYILPAHVQKSINEDEFVAADKRYGGCSEVFNGYYQNKVVIYVFIVPKYWLNDYIVALTYIIALHTRTLTDNVMPLTVLQVYYKVFITFIIYLIDIYLMSIAVSYIYTKYRELYHYDYSVKNLNIYLQHSGLARSLLRSVIEYTNHLWKRQKGNWMPELAMQAPACLREDIFCALYLHHILTPPLFRNLPEYFTRQLVARAQRIVIFPGKCIVQEGDIYSVIFFVHEGEIEKWYNYNSNERKLASLLSTNGYFGLIPGLFPNTRFLFTYVSRTVVDLIYLRLRDWQDLLNAYPDVKIQLYQAVRQMKSEVKKEGPSIL